MQTVRRSVHIIGLAAAGLVAAGAAQAQNVQVNRTSDYTASWSGVGLLGRERGLRWVNRMVRRLHWRDVDFQRASGRDRPHVQ